jgi:hypothetical protein
MLIKIYLITKSTTPNTDGALINWLRHAGQLYLNIQKSIREEFNPLIKTCVTRTNPATETKSIGLQANVGALFFARHIDYFIMTQNHTSIYRDLVPSRQIIVTRDFAATYQDWQKPRQHG